jgi:hypothetical protein
MVQNCKDSPFLDFKINKVLDFIISAIYRIDLFWCI